jgi:membrane protease YdiL (CAAX protease family)
VVPLFALAMILARLYERTGNILAPIMAHCLFNSANFLFIVLNVDF